MGSEKPGATRIRLLLAFAAIYVLWGSTYLAIRLAIETLPPFLMAGSRFLIAGVALYAYSSRSGRPALCNRSQVEGDKRIVSKLSTGISLCTEGTNSYTHFSLYSGQDLGKDDTGA
jgi:drug/metabolite transporter (DMT)-like permease